MEFKKYISKNIKTTHKIAQTILEELMLDINHAQQALIVILKGELGTGKTEFVKGLKDFLNIKSNVLSPTFVVMKVYDINKNNSVFKKLYHFDLYRLINNQTHNLNIDNDLANISIQDVFNNPSNIVFVEWGEDIPMLNKYKIITIEIKMANERERKITINYPNTSAGKKAKSKVDKLLT